MEHISRYQRNIGKRNLAQKIMSGCGKALLVLVLVAPVLTEIVSGNIPAHALLNPKIAIFLFLGYSFPLLIIRELSIRWRLSVLGLFLWGLAYGILNEGLLAQQIGMDDQIIREGDPLDNGGRARTQMHRVFHRAKWWAGGRGYGPFWQNIPADDRSRLTINGQATIEEDYAGIHIRLLYQEVGKEMVGDPYDIDGWPRKHAKLALLIGINAKNTTSAIRALADVLRGAPGVADPYEAAKRLLSAVKARHPDIAHAFGADAGVRLMNKDAAIAELVMMEMARATGIVPLCVHDSFVVPASQKGSLMETMERALKDIALVEANDDNLLWKHDIKNAASLVPEIPQEKSKMLPQYGMGWMFVGLVGGGALRDGWFLGGSVVGWLHHGVRTGDVVEYFGCPWLAR